mgnify:FL=1
MQLTIDICEHVPDPFALRVIKAMAAAMVSAAFDGKNSPPQTMELVFFITTNGNIGYWDLASLDEGDQQALWRLHGVMSAPFGDSDGNPTDVRFDRRGMVTAIVRPDPDNGADKVWAMVDAAVAMM